LTILQHLEELKKSLIRCLIAVALTSIISFVFWRQLFYILIRPANGINLIFVDMTEMVGTTFRVCLAAGVIFAVPYLTYEFITFVSPALTYREKKYVLLIIPWIGLMFAGGVAFSYFVLLPPALRFLSTFGSEIASAQIRIGNYVSIVTRIMLATGIMFELPVVTTLLSGLGVISSKWLAKQRKWAILLAFVLAAIITPTFDPVNQCLVAVPLIILYEMSIWLAKLVHKKEELPAALDSII
jgi:sec-independent protein translocase protein TatC